MKSLKLIRGNNISVSKERSCTSYVHNDAAPHETRCYNVKKNKNRNEFGKASGPSHCILCSDVAKKH